MSSSSLVVARCLASFPWLTIGRLSPGRYRFRRVCGRRPGSHVLVIYSVHSPFLPDLLRYITNGRATGDQPPDSVSNLIQGGVCVCVCRRGAGVVDCLLEHARSSGSSGSLRIVHNEDSLGPHTYTYSHTHTHTHTHTGPPRGAGSETTNGAYTGLLVYSFSIMNTHGN